MRDPSAIEATNAELELLKHARDLLVKWADFELAGSVAGLIRRCAPKPCGMETLRCLECGEMFDLARVIELQSECCPACQTKSKPCYPSLDVYLRINWQELRFLAQWSSNFAEGLEDRHRALLAKILNRINQVRPQGAPALTLIMEVKELQREYPNTTLIDGDGEVIVPPKQEPPAGGAA